MSTNVITQAEEMREAGDRDGVVGLLFPIIQAEPENIGARLVLARTFHEGGKNLVAARLWRQVLALEPNHEAAALGLLAASYHINQTLEVLEELRDHAAIRPIVEELSRKPDVTAPGLRLNLGCGHSPRAGYVNIDFYVEHPAIVKMDLHCLDFADGAAAEIMSVHVLEHFGQNEVPVLLAEWMRVLAPDGEMRIEVPDLEWCLRNWLSAAEEERWAWNLAVIFGIQDHEGEFHKTGFSAPRLSRLLTGAGLVEPKVDQVMSHGQPSLLGYGRKP